jgi:hypothetical protein
MNLLAVCVLRFCLHSFETYTFRYLVSSAFSSRSHSILASNTLAVVFGINVFSRSIKIVSMNQKLASIQIRRNMNVLSSSQ